MTGTRRFGREARRSKDWNSRLAPCPRSPSTAPSGKYHRWGHTSWFQKHRRRCSSRQSRHTDCPDNTGSPVCRRRCTRCRCRWLQSRCMCLFHRLGLHSTDRRVPRISHKRRRCNSCSAPCKRQRSIRSCNRADQDHRTLHTSRRCTARCRDPRKLRRPPCRSPRHSSRHCCSCCPHSIACRALRIGPPWNLRHRPLDRPGRPVPRPNRAADWDRRRLVGHRR